MKGDQSHEEAMKVLHEVPQWAVSTLRLMICLQQSPYRAVCSASCYTLTPLAIKFYSFTNILIYIIILIKANLNFKNDK